MGSGRCVVVPIRDIVHVVCWRKLPCSVFRECEREISVMVIGVVRNQVEYHSSEHLFAILFRQHQFAADTDQAFVAPGLRVNGSYCLGVYLLSVYPVKPSGHKVFIVFNVKQF